MLRLVNLSKLRRPLAWTPHLMEKKQWRQKYTNISAKVKQSKLGGHHNADDDARTLDEPLSVDNASNHVYRSGADDEQAQMFQYFREREYTYRDDVDRVEEEEKALGLFHRAQMKNLAMAPPVPIHEQRTVRVAIVGRTNAGKSSIINEIFGKCVCPVNDDENATQINQIHQLVRGDILFEFVDVPGVPDKINTNGVGEYTFRHANKLKAQRDFGGNVLRSQDPNNNYAVNDLFIKNADVVVVCAAMDSRMTLAGNLTINVYQLLQHNPHVPSILCLTKTDLFRPRARSKKYLHLEKKYTKMAEMAQIIEKLTEGHLNGKKYAEVGGPGSERPRENLIQVKPLTVEIEDSGIEMIRPMRINGMSSARHVESILRLTSSWRWDDLNEYQQRLYEAGNRGHRHFSEVVPIQLDRKKTLIPLLNAISKKAVHRPWSAADTIDQQVTATELIEEHIRAAMLQNLSNVHKHEYLIDLEHLEVNGTSPDNASIKIRALAEAPRLLTDTKHEFKIEDSRRALRRMRFEYSLIDTSKMVTVEKLENRLATLFDVRDVQVPGQPGIKLELVTPVSSDVSPVARIVSQTRGEEREQRKQLREMANETVFIGDRAPQYEDDYDFHFMAEQSQVSEQLSHMGRDELDTMGFWRPKREQSNDPKDVRKLRRQNRRYHLKQKNRTQWE